MSSPPSVAPFSSEMGYTGLANLGNTCFLNSSLQILNHVYELRTHVHGPRRTAGQSEVSPETALRNEWHELQDLMWSCNGIIAPNKFVNFVQQLAQHKGRDLFTGWAQNDLPEFLLFLIECFHKSLARPTQIRISGTQQTDTDRLAVECYRVLQQVYEKEYSEIMELFYGIHVSEIAPLDASVPFAGASTLYSMKPEPFFMLDLPMPPFLSRNRSDSIGHLLPKETEAPSGEHDGVSADRDISVYDCLDRFVRPEVLCDDNAWFNEKTGERETVIKRLKFWNFPKILVITFKRFGGASGMVKRTDLVTFPLENLNLAKYVAGYHPHKYVYDLFGVCNHMGGVMGGHYTAYVKNFKGEWLHCNDTVCELVPPDRVQASLVTPHAYCLFYRIKKSNGREHHKT